MAWRRPGNKPLSEPMMVRFTDAYASLGLNELKYCVEWFIVTVGIDKDSWVASLSVACNIIGKLFVYNDGTEKLERMKSTSMENVLGNGKDTNNEPSLKEWCPCFTRRRIVTICVILALRNPRK